MKISALIATCNRPQHLKNCLQALLNNSRPPDEIIVIDQSDTSASEEITENMEGSTTVIRYERLNRRGKSLALNRALELCSGEYLALTDDDVMVDGHWIETFLRLREEHPDIEAFCGRMLPEQEGADNNEYLNLVLDTNTKRIDRTRNPIHPGFVGANNFIARSALVRAGGYHDYFGPGGIFKSNNDGELCYRLIRSGTEILYDPRLVVFHSSWRQGRDIQKLKRNYAFGLGAFAGHYCRQGHLALGWHILLILLQKCRRLFLGVLLFDRERIRDGSIHIRGIAAGFANGFLTPLPRGFSAR